MDKALEVKNGRFYIAMGFNGFNLPANNGSGYSTAARALAAAKRCGYRPFEGRPPLTLGRDTYYTNSELIAIAKALGTEG